MTGPNMPNAAPSSFSENISLIRPSPCGSITAPKMPWTPRNAMSISGDCETAHSSEPAVNPSAPMMNILRRPTMSPSRPPVIRPTAMARVYAAPSHWIMLALPPMSARIDGAAMLVISASSRSMTSAASRTNSAIQRRGYGSGAVDGAATGAADVAMVSSGSLTRTTIAYRTLFVADEQCSDRSGLRQVN